MSPGQRSCQARVPRQEHIEKHQANVVAYHGTGFVAYPLACDHFYETAVLKLHRGDFLLGDIPILRLVHLSRGRQIDPELIPPQQAIFLFGNFGMNDTAACAHPLHTSRADNPFVAATVTMTHAAADHIA